MSEIKKTDKNSKEKKKPENKTNQRNNKNKIDKRLKPDVDFKSVAKEIIDNFFSNDDSGDDHRLFSKRLIGTAQLVKSEISGAAGRPSKYDEKFPSMLIEHMSKGLSFECFAGAISSTEETIHQWVKEYPEFSEAKKMGAKKSQLFWENIGIKGATGYLKDFNSTSWIFNMKNRFSWRDKPDGHETTTVIGFEFEEIT